MAIDRVKFYQELRNKKLFSKLTTEQVQSIDTILNYWEQSGFTDLRWLAYMFGTILHETGRTMLPIEEWGKGKGRPYGKKLKHSGVAYTKPDKIYYGRSYVQLTWYENYELMGRLIGEDLLNHPELALEPNVAVKILFEGMTKGSSSFGDFTGKCLEMYFNKTTEDWINARRIINSLDKAKTIANYSKTFLTCLQ
jgi:putative chitinase